MKDKNTSRKVIIQFIFILFFVIFVARLMALQIFNESYKSEAAKNAVKKRKVYATRGLIYDRYGKLVVFNDAIYDLYVIPRQVKDIDTAKFCHLLSMDQATFEKNLSKAKSYSSYKASVFLKQVSAHVYSRFQEYLREFPGFYGQVRAIRHYPYKSAAHILGDVGEVDSAEIMRSKQYYQPGDYIGKSGIEQIYEPMLRGNVGVKYIFVDALNREQGRFKEGKLDTIPQAGRDVVTTLDIDLQIYGETLMQNKKGSIVAIEPATGEILAMVSSPGFDPNLLCGRQRGRNFRALSVDTLDPLFNRPIMAQYPPGSTFKPLIALVALQENAIHKNFSYTCKGSYYIPGLRLRCSHGHPSAKNVIEALQHSCNPYFWQTFRNSLDIPEVETFQESYNQWYKYVTSFGLGTPVGVDIPGEQSGNIPPASYYDNLYGKRGWKSSTIISLGIGQGEILLTPIQLANLFAIIANKGYYYTPHILKGHVEDSVLIRGESVVKHKTLVDPINFEPVIDGLEAVVERGTGRRSKMRDIKFGGKTGTAQNPHGENHSIFGAIGPMEKPKIAIAVVVENSGGGSRYAAPIASLMIEKYLNDSIADYRKHLESGILEADLLNVQ